MARPGSEIAMNSNHIKTDQFSNPVALSDYQTQWKECPSCDSNTCSANSAVDARFSLRSTKTLASAAIRNRAIT
jgi:hypothetical protein